MSTTHEFSMDCEGCPACSAAYTEACRVSASLENHPRFQSVAHFCETSAEFDGDSLVRRVERIRATLATFDEHPEIVAKVDHYRALSSAIKLVSGIVQHGKEEIGRTARIVHSLYFQSHELWVELNRLDIPLFASAFDASRSNRYYPAPTFDRTRAAA